MDLSLFKFKPSPSKLIACSPASFVSGGLLLISEEIQSHLATHQLALELWRSIKWMWNRKS